MTIQDLDKKILKTVLYLNCQGCNKTKIKHKKGVFVMDTKMMSQFSVMDNEMLACVEGGDEVGAGEVVQALGICTIGGAALGSVIPVVGTFAGGILGAQFCTAVWGALRAS